MNLKPLIPALVLVLTALVPSGAQANIECTVTATSANVPVAEQWCNTILGPGSIDLQKVTGVGLGLCFLPAGFPFNCDGTQPIPGIGSAFFQIGAHAVVDGWGATRNLQVDVEYTGANCGAGGEFCGFSVTACQDVDDSGVCSGTDSREDFTAVQAGNLHPLGDD